MSFADYKDSVITHYVLTAVREYLLTGERPANLSDADFAALNLKELFGNAVTKEVQAVTPKEATVESN